MKYIVADYAHRISGAEGIHYGPYSTKEEAEKVMSALHKKALEKCLEDYYEAELSLPEIPNTLCIEDDYGNTLSEIIIHELKNPEM